MYLRAALLDATLTTKTTLSDRIDRRVGRRVACRQRRLEAEGHRSAPEHPARRHVQKREECGLVEGVLMEDPFVQVGNRHVQQKPGTNTKL